MAAEMSEVIKQSGWGIPNIDKWIHSQIYFVCIYKLNAAGQLQINLHNYLFISGERMPFSPNELSFTLAEWQSIKR